MAPSRHDLRALRDMINEAHRLFATTTLPEGRSERAYELLTAAVHLIDDLLSVSPAAALGKKGGKATAKRGPDYYSKISAMRRTHKGGRPPSKSKPN